MKEKKLIIDMNRLMKMIAQLIQEKREGDAHFQICRICADYFELWDDEDRFPIWLSRIVEGEMRDANWSNG